MKALKKILVPVDLSESSAQTLQQAIDIAHRCHAQIILLHVYHRPLLRLRGNKAYEKRILHSLEQSLLNHRENRVNSGIKSLFKGAAELHDIKYTILKKRGFLLERIMETIKDHHIDLVVMGLNDINNSRNLWNYRVAKLARKIKVPLLVLPYHAEITSPVKIAFAYDLKEIADLEELNIIKIFSSIYNSEIQIFTVKKENKLSKEEKMNLDKIREFFEGYDPVIHAIRDIDIEHGILRYLHKHHVSMVTIIHRARNVFQRIFHKSISKRMALDSKVPVLTIEEH